MTLGLSSCQNKQLPFIADESSGCWPSHVLTSDMVFCCYQHLSHATSAHVGLMFGVYEVCVPSSAAYNYGCEIWGFQHFPQQYSALRLELVASYQHMLKEIVGVRSSSPTDILLAELGLKPLQHVWLLRADKFWNNLACKPPGSIYTTIALDCCRAAVGSS